MGNVYDSIITALTEAIDDAKGEGKKLKKRVVSIEPIKRFFKKFSHTSNV